MPALPGGLRLGPLTHDWTEQPVPWIFHEKILISCAASSYPFTRFFFCFFFHHLNLHLVQRLLTRRTVEDPFARSRAWEIAADAVTRPSRAESSRDANESRQEQVVDQLNGMLTKEYFALSVINKCSSSCFPPLPSARQFVCVSCLFSSSCTKVYGVHCEKLCRKYSNELGKFRLVRGGGRPDRAGELAQHPAQTAQAGKRVEGGANRMQFQVNNKNPGE